MPAIRVVALVATCRRPALLQRALSSIGNQSRRPDALVLVVDEPQGSNDQLIPLAPLPEGIKATVLRNRREQGASGSWNTGLDEITRRVDEPATTYVAILDDDDWWDPDHLLRCADTVERENSDLVTPRLIRHDDGCPSGRPLTRMPTLNADLALIRNTGIQGSNLFVRLSTLLEAGCFDESLHSTTDRDLVIRLADLGIRFTALDAATVHHDAIGGRDRLSTPGSLAKSAGLKSFAQKYQHRMNSDQHEAFRARASTVFLLDVDMPSPRTPFSAERPIGSLAAASDTTTPLHLIVGITTDGDLNGVARVSRLLSDLHALLPDARLATLDTVLVENGDGGAVLAAEIERFRKIGLQCRHARVEDQQQDAADGIFGPHFQRKPGRVSIADSRTMVQRYCRMIAPVGAVVWILDDDKRLSSLVLRDGHLRLRPEDTIGQLLALRSSGVDIVLGIDTGSAPLPASMTMRVQLVDLQANLADLKTLSPTAQWPDRLPDNLAKMEALPDAYYHDLAHDSTWHLESPFGFVPESQNTTVHDTFLELCRRAPRILAGEQVFRRLFVRANAPLHTRPSVQRGGNTLFVDLDALVDVPNRMPEANGRSSRRSDMVSSIFNASVRGRRVEQASFAVYHDRSDLDVLPLNVDTLVDDIRGFALYSMLKNMAADSLSLENLNPTELTNARNLHEKYLEERTAALVLSLHRARGAAQTAHRKASDATAWWWQEPSCAEAAHSLIAFLEGVLEQLTPSLIKSVRTAVARTPDHAVTSWLNNLGSCLEWSKLFCPTRPSWLTPSRHEHAQAIIERVCSPTAPITLLGSGEEGVTFTDSRLSYKCLDRWQERADATKSCFLRGLVGAWDNTRGLIPLIRLDESTQNTVLVMRYVRGTPYRGGYGPGLVTLLRECHDHNIACRNLHPKNLVVDGENVCLIDYGGDVRPLDASEWRHMVRRAWLCWRWAEHTDLQELMTRALTEDLPEIDGWERLAQAVFAGDAKEELDALILDSVLTDVNGLNSESRHRESLTPPYNVLDYGCGSGKLVSLLTDHGIQAVGYDPQRSHYWSDTTCSTYTTDLAAAMAASPFDTVICSLVLCTLDDEDYQQALSNLRASVRDGGRVVVAVCHPFYTRGGDTSLQSRIKIPDSTRLGDDATFTWTKRMRRTGNLRRDVHRPLHILQRDLLRAGIFIESTTETSTVDFDRLEHASDFIVLTGYALPPGPEVSLVVRVSALEWRTLEVQVRHVVGQLETPRAFRERLVVLDPRVEGFTRAHDTPDLESARATLDQLVADGTIDRIIEPSKKFDDIKSLHQRWFALHTEATHTIEGAPVTSALVGFEACTGDYVLHVDDDLMIHRQDRSHDVIRELVDALSVDETSVAASLNIVQAADKSWTNESQDGPWRVEARGTMLHRTRLLASRPWPNEMRDCKLSIPWHRSLDLAVDNRGLRSLRGGRASFGFIHPPNTMKADTANWLAILDRVEQGFIPKVQRGRVDLAGTFADWLGPRRNEPLVVVSCGRNVSAGRVARFRDSIDSQESGEIGLVVVEDGGTQTARDVVRRAFAMRSRTTLLTLPDRRGALANLVMVLRHTCQNPDTVVVLVDLDDALLGTDALARVMTAFDAGHDLAIGGMRRTDKVMGEPPRFTQPRADRGGAVWQHLRAFRRSLFDRIPDSALRDDDGQYFDLASDWALMLALAELADAPHKLEGTLYLHEPSGHGKQGLARERREAIISRILARTSLRPCFTHILT